MTGFPQVGQLELAGTSRHPQEGQSRRNMETSGSASILLYFWLFVKIKHPLKIELLRCLGGARTGRIRARRVPEQKRSRLAGLPGSSLLPRVESFSKRPFLSAGCTEGLLSNLPFPTVHWIPRRQLAAFRRVVPLVASPPKSGWFARRALSRCAVLAGVGRCGRLAGGDFGWGGPDAARLPRPNGRFASTCPSHVSGDFVPRRDTDQDRMVHLARNSRIYSGALSGPG